MLHLLRLGFFVTLLHLLFPQPLAAVPTPTRLANGTPLLTTTDGVRLHANISGRGLPCVFVHGGPGAWSGMPQALAGPSLEDRLQMIWLDQRGSGRSQNAPDHNYSLDRMVQDLEEVRQQLGLESWVVMAHSFGGTIATEYAARYPQRVRGLVLINCTLYLHEAMTSTLTHGLRFVQVPDPAFFLDESKPLDARFGALMPHLTAQQGWQKLQYQTEAGHQKVTAADQGNPGTGEFGGYGFRLPDYHKDFTLLTPAISAPVLVITGTTDYCVGPEHYRLFRFPNQQVAQLQTGHVPFVEAPAAFRNAVQRFVKGLSRKGA
ncbi:proline iminopeptidase [Hymenobacter luteus]|uniref:Proline iminopeptidase n=2 Tax=Hymenobacter TaxID=89966 RepID=A0A7W9T530_9BACT|nr:MULTISPECIES: alpha/beta hydrolase [Hymenobacter]MBB4603123.1 proline iminopeptidase [Hymenobacter latericoloratus]MBB6060918.1 proline iminopeptidase [Hymenobacter luteus]